MKNLIVRTISGIVFLLVMLAALLLGNVIDCGKYFFALGMLFALIVMMHEFYREDESYIQDSESGSHNRVVLDVSGHFFRPVL